MARVNRNNASKGISGQVDQFVYREKNGETVVSKLRRKSHKPPTSKQEQVRLKFKNASLYARICMQDPQLKSFYESKAEPGQTAYNMAFADYYDAPEIHEINVSAYTGIVGSKLVLVVDDRFRVASVKVKIEKSDGTLIETGDAIMKDNGPQWEYTCTAANAAIAGSVITVTASDLPGNSGVKQKTL
jgi:hypothetical protein